MTISPAALILVDIQTGLEAGDYWGERNNPDAEDKAGELLAHWRMNGWPLVHIGHESTNPKSPLQGAGTAFKPQVLPAPDETVMMKNVNSSFIGTNLESHLRDQGITDLVICGLTTPHCVSTTARMAANLGFSVKLVGDACAAFTSSADTSFDNGPAMDAEAIHRAALAHLHGEFVEVVKAATLIR